MASETAHRLIEAPGFDEAWSRLTIHLDVVDGHTVHVTGLSLRDLVERLQREHETDLLVISNDDDASEPFDLGNLSEREVGIVRLITLGRSNRAIAGELFLSVNTVKTYIRSAYRKMGVASRTQAVMWGVQHGFVMQDFADTFAPVRTFP